MSDIEEPKLRRFAEAYMLMAEKARFRPQAPSDGFGHILLTDEQMKDRALLLTEARAFAEEFNEEEGTDSFWIGCSDFRTNRAFVWTIQAAYALAGCSNEIAVKLLQMAVEEVKAEIAKGGVLTVLTVTTPPAFEPSHGF